ncbi:intermembrane transport protein PqiB [Paraburkholderia aromaticivorans]|uniref:Mammalian cell entry protein n=1 Tax=Paraburkholderia aromaticivorans TaxID=2026199 RepID=A0A248VJY6_9BURK|nr:MlaD family protein [Paraburkholderia aromaticivorans]ASV99325.1 mammalian cell entry protein [Paraburkholderia aromaticivorans]
MQTSPPSLSIWLASLAAAAICVVFLISRVAHSGPEVAVSFLTAEGLEAGKTRVRYKNVEIGRLEKLRLSADRTHVLAVVQFDPSAKRFATCDTRFWVVRPRIGMTGVTGLATLVSAPYLAVDVGRASTLCNTFIGMETPPSVARDQNGGRFVLHAASLGSLNVGSPVYFRRVQAGRVLNYSPSRNGVGVAVDVFVKTPYDRYVTSRTRWWHASGIDLRLDASGLRLDIPSVAAVLSGGVVFDLPATPASTERAADGAAFALAATQAEAMNHADDGPAASVRMRFDGSVRGLTIGAPVEFEGVELGEVTGVDVGFNPKDVRFDMVVTLDLYPYRLGRRYREALGHGSSEAGKALLHQLVAQGLRGQLRMGSVLTGQRYVALDFFPHARAASIDTRRLPVELPTVPNTLEELQDQLANLVDRLDNMPIEQIGANLNQALVHAQALFLRIDTELVPQARTTLETAEQSFNAANATLQQDSPMQTDIRRALTELRRTLASLKALSDYVEQHPESLVWGKPAGS